MRDIILHIRRARSGAPPRTAVFRVSVPDEANVLDAIEQAWAKHDRSLMFRHACHHASCGTCGVRINGVEKLPCITPVRDYAPGKPLAIEPLRNFELIGDLVVDPASMFQRQEKAGMPITRIAAAELDGKATELPPGIAGWTRFENCIECGICLSACPTMAADFKFFGPAGLAAIKRALDETNDPKERRRLLDLADGEHGVWRCHSAWECTERCPQDVKPAESIMSLRRALTARRLRQLFKRE